MNRDEVLLAQIEAKRNDEAFMARLRQRMIVDKPILDRLAEPREWRHLVEPFKTSTMLRCPGVEPPRLVHYNDGTYGVEHKCRVLGDTGIICAPRLSPEQYRVTFEDRKPTATGPTGHDSSISCPDCDLHGFIKDGSWIPS